MLRLMFWGLEFGQSLPVGSLNCTDIFWAREILDHFLGLKYGEK